MATGTQSHIESKSNPRPSRGPEIACCETSPGKSVFVESGNTDGWIASDTTVEVSR